MRGINHLLGSLAVAGMMLASSVEVSAASAAVGGGSSDSGVSLCRVKVSRTASPGVFDITRQILNNGKCVCRVTTGPSSQGGSAESALAGLLLRRTCADAPLAAAGAAGGIGSGALIGGALLVGGGLAAALATGGSKSP